MEELIRSPALSGLIAGLVTWLFTSIGAGTVFLRKEFSRTILDTLLGFAAGVMIAASVWSLLIPALELSGETWGRAGSLFPVSTGFLLGALALRLLDFIIPHLHPLVNQEEGLGACNLQRHILLILAITLHNIPEALAVGVSFGAAAIDPELGIASAITLMFGIGLQNIPEGMAVAVPLLREGCSKRRAFFYGQLSGLVEPVAALIGALLASTALAFLPWALSFAAGAMFYVTIEEVIPEANASGNGNAATLGAILGFICMMCMDVAFG